MTTPQDSLPPLITALCDGKIYGQPGADIQLLQTHISYVFLTGRYAYKIKKPVNLGFLDFSTLDKRHHYCEEELRLNRRLAPQLYLEVVPITGSPAHPVLGCAGTAIEYAVKMAEFPQQARLDHVLAQGGLTSAQIDALASQIAVFHNSIAVAGSDSMFGTPARVLQPALENFEQIRPLLDDTNDLAALDELQSWTQREYTALEPAFAQRKQDGFIRECHGDLHLANIALVNGAITIFDCIEFNDNLRWIDVLSEIAFLVMDLMDRNRPEFAYRALNAYLELSGDYSGLGVLRFYLTYRAMVRAKVATIRLHQAGLGQSERTAIFRNYRSYIQLAQKFTAPPRPALLITHGLSGSGKTTWSQSILESLGAIRIRSDVERKRLFGLSAESPSQSGVASGLYAADATHLTYQHLAKLAQAIVAAGFTVLVDATFLQQSQRSLFRELAQAMGVPFVILDFQAVPATLRQRIVQRRHAAQDASEADLAVLEHQYATQQPLAPDELPLTIPFMTGEEGIPTSAIEALQKLCNGF